MSVLDDPNQILTGLQTFGSGSASATLSIVGLVLLVIAGLTLYFTSGTEAQRSLPIRIALLISLAAGILFSAAGPFVALRVSSPRTMGKITPQVAFDRLQRNDEVRWLIRFVLYSDNNVASKEELAIDKLETIGPKDQLFSFVADYEELAGYTVKQAIEMTGNTYKGSQHISVIIFPLRTQFYPANVRGILQLIQEVEKQKGIDFTKSFFAGENSLNGEEIRDLEGSTKIPSYRVKSFLDYYPHYCQLAQKFRCKKTYLARPYIGDLAPDWHPLGFSQRSPDDDYCKPGVVQEYCQFSDWNSARSTWLASFGSRAFLMENLPVQKIADRILVDFKDPGDKIIPDIGLR